MNHLKDANERINQLAGLMNGKTLIDTEGPFYLGVDIGTANVVSVVVNGAGAPVAGEIEPARVVREGMVIDYFRAIQIVRAQIDKLEQRLNRELIEVVSAVPPGTEEGNGRITKNILEAANLEVLSIVDEPSAASYLLGIENGAVVDVGGGTTGISIIDGGRIVYTADEATGGFHMDLVIAGALGISIEEAEAKKRDETLQRSLYPVIKAVFEKIAAITTRHIKGHAVGGIYLVGGACAFPGFQALIAKELGIPTFLTEYPLYVTPLGIALVCREMSSALRKEAC